MKNSSQQKEKKLIHAQKKAAAWNQIPWDTRAGTALNIQLQENIQTQLTY